MYQLTSDPDVVIDLDSNTSIPRGHRWWTDYEAWVAAGNTPEPLVLPSLAETKASLCIDVDASADATYIAIGGPSPGRLAEYQQAKADAIAFKDAGYTGTVPSTVQSWATASGMTSQEATDNILATAAQWATALDYIRAQRLQGKANVNAAADAVAAQSAADSAIANIRAAATGL